MTRSSRILNRLILAVVGIALLVAAGWIAWPLITDIPRLGVVPAEDDREALVILTVALIVVGVASLAWIATRGRGRTRDAFTTQDLRVDASAVGALLKRRIEAAPDVIGVASGAYRVRRQPMLLLAVQVRRHADLPALNARLTSTVHDVEALLGAEIPIAIHVTSGVRTKLIRPRVAH